jgi:hypothetical protein
MMDRCEGRACIHVMLMRCSECGREQWAPIVWAVSHGDHPCAWCAQFNPVQVLPRSVRRTWPDQSVPS